MKKSILRSGFTIIELLVVIAIIGLLTGIVMTSLSPAKGKGRDAKRVSDLGQIQLALELYFDRCKQYPQSWAAMSLEDNNGCPTNGAAINFGSFISQIPQPPTTNEAYYYVVNDSHDNYILRTELENENNPALLGKVLLDEFDTGSETKGVGCSAAKVYCLGPK